MLVPEVVVDAVTVPLLLGGEPETVHGEELVRPEPATLTVVRGTSD